MTHFQFAKKYLPSLFPPELGERAGAGRCRQRTFINVIQEDARTIVEPLRSDVEVLNSEYFGQVDREFFFIFEGTDFQIRGYSADQGSEVFLPADEVISFSAYDPLTGEIASFEGVTSASGVVTNLPTLVFRIPTNEFFPNPENLDFDDDGLNDLAEHIIGTSGIRADSDGDSLSDGFEIENGLDPLGGFPTTAGVIETLNLGTSVTEIVMSADISGTEILAIVTSADGSISFLEIQNRTSASLLAQIDVGTRATDVALDGSLALAAVATGSDIKIIDVSSPDTPQILTTIRESVSFVEVENGRLFAADDGEILVYDLVTGARLQSQGQFVHLVATELGGRAVAMPLDQPSFVNAVGHDLQGLCSMIERRLSFVSLEDLGFRQLRAANEQREHLREIGFAMVAELQKPLEALPDRITSAIAERMDPILDRVGSMGTSSVEGLVGDLSSQLSHSVGNALTQASVSLGEATDRIGLMVDRMNMSNAQAGEGMQTALTKLAESLADMRSEIASSGQAAAASMTAGAEQMLAVMNETLGGIRENTAKGAEAMGTAAAELRQAAEGFREQLDAASAEGAAALQARMAASTAEAGSAIDGAGKSLLDAFEATAANIARLGGEMGGAISDDLMGRVQSVGKGLDEIARALADGAASANSAATGLNDGASAISGASITFGNASRNLKRQPVLSVAAYGPDRPVTTNDTEAGRATNRRIDLRFIMVTPQDTNGIAAIRAALEAVE